jgi:flagellar biosynthetic protein FliO
MSGMIAFIRKWWEASNSKQKLVVSLMAISLLATGVLLAIGGGSETTNDPLGSTPLYFVSAFVKLLGVLLLIVGCSVIFRRWLQAGSGGKAVRQMRLLETVRLSPKQALHLVVIGDQKILIGATDQNVSLITHIEESINPVPAEEPQVQPGLDFGSLIQSFNFNSSNENLKGKE